MVATRREKVWQHEKFIDAILAGSLAKKIKAACKEWDLERFGVIPRSVDTADENHCQLCNMKIWKFAIITNRKTHGKLVIGLDCYDKLIQAQATGQVYSALPERKQRTKEIRAYIKIKRPDKTFMGWFKEQLADNNLPREIAAIVEEVKALTVPGTTQGVDMLIGYYKAMRQFPTETLLTPGEITSITNYLDIPLGETITLDRVNTLKAEWNNNRHLAVEHNRRWHILSRKFGIGSLQYGRDFLTMLIEALAKNAAAPADMRQIAAQIGKNCGKVSDADVQKLFDWCTVTPIVPANDMIGNASLEYYRSLQPINDLLTRPEMEALWQLNHDTPYDTLEQHRRWYMLRTHLAELLQHFMPKLEQYGLLEGFQQRLAALPAIADQAAKDRANVLKNQLNALASENQTVILYADSVLIEQAGGWQTYRRLGEAVTDPKRVLAAVLINKQPGDGQWFGEAVVVELQELAPPEAVAFNLPDRHHRGHFLGRAAGKTVVAHKDTPVTKPGSYLCLFIPSKRPYVVAQVLTKL